MSRKKSIPEATRRTVALRYGCEPGTEKRDVPCHWCGVLGTITWWRRPDGKPAGWVSFSHELDHLIPEADGGSGEPDNIVLACRSCNRRRGHRMGSNSPHPHHILSEQGSPSSSDTHPRKGTGNREGNREVVSSIHVPNCPRANSRPVDNHRDPAPTVMDGLR